MSRIGLLFRISNPLNKTLFSRQKVTRFSCLSYSTARLTDAEARKPTLEVDNVARSKVFQRPISPHLTIFKPWLTMLLSGTHRATGTALALGFYGGAIAYAVVPFASVDFISLVHSIPAIAFLPIKFLVASSFVFHSLNGLRHLMWDTATGLTLKGVYNSGYIVLAGTLISSVLLMFW